MGDSPQEKTLLVGQITTLSGAKGKDEFIAAANLASNRSVARLYRIVAEMMAGYNMRVAEVASIGRAAGTPYLRKKDGTAILLLPLDYIFPSDDVSSKLRKINESLDKEGVSGKELWITGRTDDSAATMFQDSGWKVFESVGQQLMKE